MKKVVCFSILAMLLASCALSNGMATVTLELPESIGGGRALGFLAAAQSIEVSVSGPGMGTMSSTYGVGTERVSLTVPSGSARTILVHVTLPSDPDSILYGFWGEATVDLAPFEETSVAIRLSPETPTLIPDYYNNRVVRIDSMTGSGWATKTLSGPTDIAVDRAGQTYVATYGGTVNKLSIWSGVFTTFSSTLYTYGLWALALDEPRGYLYALGNGSTGWGVSRIDLASGVATAVISDTAGYITQGYNGRRGLAVDADGILYLFDETNSTDTALVKYDLASSSKVVASRARSQMGIPDNYVLSDVMVRGDYVYVAAYYYSMAPSVYGRLVRLNRADLSYAGTYAASTSFPPASGSALLANPRSFVAVNNRKFTLIEEYYYYDNGGDQNHLASFDSFGSGTMEFYGATGSGTGQFTFYDTYYC